MRLGDGKILVLGATGLAGQAICGELRRRGSNVVGVARHDSDRCVDIADLAALVATLNDEAPDIVVNCAGLVDVGACEREPWPAWQVNALPLVEIAEWSYRTARPFIHISTDHYYRGDGPARHDETAHVRLINQYARQKLAAESFALTAPRALVLRTSIVGIRRRDRPTFAEWAIAAVLGDVEVTLFSDAWTSSLDVDSFARAALDLLAREASGVVNLGAAEPYSKESFVREIARQLGVRLTRARSGSVHAGASVPRGDSLGLDVGKAEQLLDYRLPLLPEIVQSVLQQHERHPV